ncbi:hypothetical protein KAR91_57255 [Candidatus Pacearchaeota archaeon]|nr:hypothetical protein [Candidatus Pacearchaeota archaeon]
MKPLTPATMKVLLAIGNYQHPMLGSAIKPTIREIANIVGTKCPTVQQHVNYLLLHRYLIKIQPGRHSRNYKLTLRSMEILTKPKP